MVNDFDILPVKQELLSAKDFLELKKNNPHLIAHTKIVPPKLGADDFGGILVQYSRPMYKNLEFTKK